MAQLRQDHAQFQARGAEILVVAPDDAQSLHDYWARNGLPYTCLPDPDHTVADVYGQEVKLLKLGRLPTLVVVSRDGHILYVHHASSMSDIPPDGSLLSLLDEINAAQ